MRSLKLQAAALSRSGRRTYFTRSSIESRGITHFFQKHDLCHEITVVPSFFLKRGWALNHHSQINCGLCLHVELSESTVALVVIRALAAIATCCFASLSPHNHRILNFLNHSSNGGPGALQRCVDIQCTVTGILETTRKHIDQNLDILGFYTRRHTLGHTPVLSRGMREACELLSGSSD